jgi:hypothetical protein
MDNILPKLWLGDVSAANNQFLLKKAKVTHILTVGVGL